MNKTKRRAIQKHRAKGRKFEARHHNGQEPASAVAAAPRTTRAPATPTPKPRPTPKAPAEETPAESTVEPAGEMATAE